MKRTFNPPTVWAPKGRGFSMGVEQPHGHLIHFTGQVAWDANENIIGKGDVAEQTRQCFRNLDAMLAFIGGRLDDIVSLTTYYTAPDQLPDIQKVRTRCSRLTVRRSAHPSWSRASATPTFLSSSRRSRWSRKNISGRRNNRRPSYCSLQYSHIAAGLQNGCAAQERVFADDEKC